MNNVKQQTASCHIGQSINHRHNVDKEYRESLEHTNKVDEPIKVLINQCEENGKTNFELSNTRKRELMLNQKFKIKNKDGVEEEKTFHEANELMNEKAIKARHKERVKTDDELIFSKKKGHKKGEEGKDFFDEYEIIYQVGNKDTVGKNEPENNLFVLETEENVDPELAKKILEDASKKFIDKFENKAILTQLVLHFDETTPHAHMCMVPCFWNEDGKKIETSFHNMAKSFLNDEQKERARELGQAEYLRKKEKNPKAKTTEKSEIEKQMFGLFQKEVFVGTLQQVALEHGVKIKNPEKCDRIHQSKEDFKTQSLLNDLNHENQNLALSLASTRKREQALAKELAPLYENFKPEQKETLAEAVRRNYNSLVSKFNNLLKNFKSAIEENKKLQQEKTDVLKELKEAKQQNEILENDMVKVGQVLYYTEDLGAKELIYKSVSDASTRAIEYGEEAQEQAHENDYSRGR